MRKQNKSKQSFYQYLQKYFTGRLVAYSKKAKVVYADGKSVKELIEKLKRKKISLTDVVFTGPIQKPGRTYVYKISVCIKTDVTPLLGRLDVWDNFSLLFDNKSKETVFYKL